MAERTINFANISINMLLQTYRQQRESTSDDTHSNVQSPLDNVEANRPISPQVLEQQNLLRRPLSCLETCLEHRVDSFSE